MYIRNSKSDLATALYIPIWFYSNNHFIFNTSFLIAFTFQSGSIQIIPTVLFIVCVKFFTFQSGSIQMIRIAASPYTATTFTFQSGSIQIACP